MADESKLPQVTLKARRETVIDALSRHFVKDDLDLEAFEARLDRVHAATSFAELDAVLADLEPLGETAALARAAPSPLPVSREETGFAVAVMGGVRRSGSWLAPEALNAIAIMGGVDLDFREVRLPPGETVVNVFALMGGVDIIVPPDLAVICEGHALMGGFEDLHRASALPDPEQPLLRIRGFAVMGGVDVKTRLRGESARAARRRERAEHRMRSRRHGA